MYKLRRKTRTVITFTGHRPNKLYGYQWDTPGNKIIMNRLTVAILNCMRDSGHTEFLFICGGALGIDQMAFHILTELRTKLSSKYKIKIQLAIPFKDQPIKWNDQQDRNRYRKHLLLADEIVYVDTLEKYDRCKDVPHGAYHKDKLLIRNEYMVDHADHIIATWNGDKQGGTAHCVRYADKKGCLRTTVSPLI